MKRFPPPAWHEAPKFKIFGLSESTRGWIAFLLVALVLVTLVLAFVYSSHPGRVTFPPR
jgi:hypothetical protein